MQRTPFLPRDVAPLILGFVQNTAVQKRWSGSLVSETVLQKSVAQILTEIWQKGRLQLPKGCSLVRDHTSRAVKVDAQLTRFRSELSTMWTVQRNQRAKRTQIQPGRIELPTSAVLRPRHNQLDHGCFYFLLEHRYIYKCIIIATAAEWKMEIYTEMVKEQQHHAAGSRGGS